MLEASLLGISPKQFIPQGEQISLVLLFKSDF